MASIYYIQCCLLEREFAELHLGSNRIGLIFLGMGSPKTIFYRATILRRKMLSLQLLQYDFIIKLNED